MTRRQFVGRMAIGFYALILLGLGFLFFSVPSGDESIGLLILVVVLAAGLLPLLTALAVLKIKPAGKFLKLSWAVVVMGLFLHYWFIGGIFWGVSLTSFLVFFGNLLITLVMLYFFRRKINSAEEEKNMDVFD